MTNIFITPLIKYPFIYGIAISLITSILIIVTTLEFADRIQEDLIVLPITLLMFMTLFFIYVSIKTSK